MSRCLCLHEAVSPALSDCETVLIPQRPALTSDSILGYPGEPNGDDEGGFGSWSCCNHANDGAP